MLHMVEPPPEDPADSLRIFVVFSGMAGAWRNLKELDGRFFGGRKIVRAGDSSTVPFADRSAPCITTRRSLTRTTAMVQYSARRRCRTDGEACDASVHAIQGYTDSRRTVITAAD